MPIDQNALAGLTAPIPPPGELATQAPFTPTQQIMNAGIAGTGQVQHKLPLGSGTTTLDDSPVDNRYNITGIAEESVGGNVGGVVGKSAEDLKPQTAYIPDVEDVNEKAFEGQISEFHDIAGEEGRSGARKVKRSDRRSDRAARRREDLKGGEKRRMRRAQRRQRKDAWRTYKGEEDLATAEEAANLEIL